MTGIQEYGGITNPALLNRLFNSGGMLFGMQLNEILWVCCTSTSEIGLYGLITVPWVNKSVYSAGPPAYTYSIASISTGDGIVGSVVPAVEEKKYNIMDFFVGGVSGVFKGIKVKSLSEARELPSFYIIDEEMINSLVIESFRNLDTKIYSNEVMKSAQQRPKERTGKAVNFNQKEEKKDRMILI